MTSPNDNVGFDGAPADALLFERRVLLVVGDLDGTATTELAARLMTLDALGDGPVELRLGSCRGSLGAALAILDVLDVVGVEVTTTGYGTIEGGPVAIVGAGSQRALARHARLRLSEPQIEAAGTAGELERTLAAHAAVRDQFFEFVAGATQRAVDDVIEAWSRRCVLDAVDAVSLGYADGILGD